MTILDRPSPCCAWTVCKLLPAPHPCSSRFSGDILHEVHYPNWLSICNIQGLFPWTVPHSDVHQKNNLATAGSRRNLAHLRCRQCATNKRNPSYRHKRCSNWPDSKHALQADASLGLHPISCCAVRETRSRRRADILVYPKLAISTSYMPNASFPRPETYFFF